MRRLLLYAILILLLLPSCSKSTGPTVRVVKPRYHHRWYNKKKDRKTKRVKTVKMKN